jgi:putative tricarboxylic transport membrane protein
MAEFATFGHLFLHSLSYWWVIVPSVLLGMIVGALPGFSAANTIIVLLPLTLAMPVEVGLIFMIAIYCSSHMGAGIPAILVNIPGTAGAAATPLDGYPMAKKGRAQQALAISFIASCLGGLLTTILALFAMPVLAQVGYYMHSVELIVVMLFGISLIATIAAGDTLKGLIAGFFGLMIGAIGSDYVYATPRGTFGFLELYDGVPVIPALVGLFALSESFLIMEDKIIVSDDGQATVQRASWAATFEGLHIALTRWWHIVWTSIIGLVVGVIPANNGVTSGTMVPLLTLGIPGGETAAIMLIVLQYHGVNFGPTLFALHPEIGYGVFTAMTVTYLLMLVTALPIARYMSHVTLVPIAYLAPLIVAFTLLGAFVPRQYMFDMGLAVVFGVIGYIARKTGYHVAAILIGVILGPLLEQYFLRALKESNGDIMVLFSSTLGNVLWVALIISLLMPAILAKWRARSGAGNSALDCRS